MHVKEILNDVPSWLEGGTEHGRAECRAVEEEVAEPWVGGGAVEEEVAEPGAAGYC